MTFTEIHYGPKFEADTLEPEPCTRCETVAHLMAQGGGADLCEPCHREVLDNGPMEDHWII